MRSILQSLPLAAILVGMAAPPATAGERPVTRVGIVMFDGVQIIDFAAPYEVFGHAGFDVYTASADGGTVTTAMSLSVNVDHDFASAPQADILLIPGGDVGAAAADPGVLAFVTERAASAEHVLSVCTGSFILAATGLLDGRSATTFHGAFDTMAARYPAVHVVRDQRWVDTGKLVTSAGLASGLDAALHVVAEARDIEAARTVAMHVEYDWSPEGGFVRGLMADQHVRLPQGLDLPAGTDYHERHSFGDERRWRSAYHVSTPLSPPAFVEHLRERAEADGSLEVLDSTRTDRVAWTYADGAGRWELSHTVTQTDAAGGFELVSELAALD